MERLSPQDASFLYVEDDVSHMHIASVAILEGPPPNIEELRGMVRAKLPLVPRYRQKVQFVPLQMGRPVWVDDPSFNLDYHVRQTALGKPGGDAELRTLVGRVMSQQLDRSKPLWEMWMVEGLAHDRWAIFSKTHHCMVDGVSGTDLLTVVLDREPDPPRDIVDDWQPAPAPSPAQLVRDALVDRVVSPYEQVRALRAAGRPLREVARGVGALSSLARSTPPTSLNGPIGPHRTWGWARSSLADVKKIRGALGGTVNDVVLSAITRGFRDILVHRGEDPCSVEIRTLVPVSVRTKGAAGPAAGDGTFNNKVSAMFAVLPVGLEDPRERLDAIHQQMQGLKESRQAEAGETLTSLSFFAPPVLLAMGTRVASRLPQRNVNTVTTNVPGPQYPLYAVGRRMIEAFPYVPLQGWVRVGVAIFSYDGNINFGVTGDYDTVPDLDVLCAGIESGMEELLKLSDA